MGAREIQTYGVGDAVEVLLEDSAVRGAVDERGGVLGVPADAHDDASGALLDVRHEVEERDLEEGSVSKVNRVNAILLSTCEGEETNAFVPTVKHVQLYAQKMGDGTRGSTHKLD